LPGEKFPTFCVFAEGAFFAAASAGADAKAMAVATANNIVNCFIVATPPAAGLCGSTHVRSTEVHYTSGNL